MNIKNLIKNVGYEAKVIISPEMWTLYLPERIEDEYSSDREIEYNIEEISKIVPKYCLSYYILASIIKECRSINYDGRLISYYEDDKEVFDEEILYYFAPSLDEKELEKLNLLSFFIQEVSENGLSKSLIQDTKKNGVYQDFIIIHDIVKGDINERL